MKDKFNALDTKKKSIVCIAVAAVLNLVQIGGWLFGILPLAIAGYGIYQLARYGVEVYTSGKNVMVELRNLALTEAAIYYLPILVFKGFMACLMAILSTAILVLIIVYPIYKELKDEGVYDYPNELLYFPEFDLQNVMNIDSSEAYALYVRGNVDNVYVNQNDPSEVIQLKPDRTPLPGKMLVQGQVIPVFVYVTPLGTFVGRAR